MVGYGDILREFTSFINTYLTIKCIQFKCLKLGQIDFCGYFSGEPLIQFFYALFYSSIRSVYSI